MVFWDLGGIMIELDRRGTAKKLAKGSRTYSEDELYALFTHQQGLVSGFWDAVDIFDEGKISDYDFYDIVAKLLDLDRDLINFSTFRKIWRELIYILPETLGLVHRLVDVRQGIISNLNRIHQSMIFTMIPRGLFDIPIFSYVEKIIKPNALIYERARRAANVEFEEILFIDDRIDNLLSAARLNIQVFHFDPKLPIEERVRRLELYMKGLGIIIKSH